MRNKIKSLLLENTSTRQTIAKNTFWLSVGTIFSRMIRALLVIYAGRVLGAAGYGVFSYALSLTAFFTIFSDIGISPLLTRQIVQKPKQTNRYLSTSFAIKIIILVITIFLTIFAAPHFTKIKEVNPLIPFVAFLLAFDSLRGFGFSITRAYNRMEIESALTFLTNLIITGLGFAVLVLFPSPKNLAAGYAIASGIGTLIVFSYLRRYSKTIKFKIDTNLAKEILGAALPFALAGILGAFMINIDMIIIGAFRTAEELGFYGAVQRIVQFTYIIFSFAAASMFPIISKFIKDNERNRASKVLISLMRFSFIFSLPIMFGGIIVSGGLITFIFGQSYAPAAKAFAVLLATVIIVAPNMLIANTLFALDKQNIFLASSAIGAAINAIFDFVLIPKYGILGSAIVTVLSLSFVVGYNWIKLRKLLEKLKFPPIMKPLAATIVMSIIAAALSGAGANVAATISLSAIAYFGILLLLKDSSVKELKMLMHNQ